MDASVLMWNSAQDFPMLSIGNLAPRLQPTENTELFVFAGGFRVFKVLNLPRSEHFSVPTQRELPWRMTRRLSVEEARVRERTPGRAELLQLDHLSLECFADECPCWTPAGASGACRCSQRPISDRPLDACFERQTEGIFVSAAKPCVTDLKFRLCSVCVGLQRRTK